MFIVYSVTEKTLLNKLIVHSTNITASLLSIFSQAFYSVRTVSRANFTACGRLATLVAVLGILTVLAILAIFLLVKITAGPLFRRRILGPPLKSVTFFDVFGNSLYDFGEAI